MRSLILFDSLSWFKRAANDNFCRQLKGLIVEKGYVCRRLSHQPFSFKIFLKYQAGREMVLGGWFFFTFRNSIVVYLCRQDRPWMWDNFQGLTIFWMRCSYQTISIAFKYWCYSKKLIKIIVFIWRSTTVYF